MKALIICPADRQAVAALARRRPLALTVEAQAQKVAQDEVARVREAMNAEDREITVGQVDREVAALRTQLLAGRRSRLWR